MCYECKDGYSKIAGSTECTNCNLYYKSTHYILFFGIFFYYSLMTLLLLSDYDGAIERMTKQVEEKR